MAGDQVEPGYYLGLNNTVIWVKATKDGSRTYAQRMIVRDGRIEWVREFGLGRDLLITPLSIREVSRRVQAAAA